MCVHWEIDIRTHLNGLAWSEKTRLLCDLQERWITQETVVNDFVSCVICRLLVKFYDLILLLSGFCVLAL